MSEPATIHKALVTSTILLFVGIFLFPIGMILQGEGLTTVGVLVVVCGALVSLAGPIQFRVRIGRWTP